MRLSLALVVVGVALPALAGARPRAQVTFAAGKGAEAVAYFAPEVARTVTARLDAAGLDAAADVAIVGHIEELSGERVRLTATVHGHTVSVEGSIENLDGVAEQLASRLVPLVAESGAHKASDAGHKAAVPGAPRKSTEAGAERAAAEKTAAGERVAVVEKAAADKPAAERASTSAATSPSPSTSTSAATITSTSTPATTTATTTSSAPAASADPTTPSGEVASPPVVASAPAPRPPDPYLGAYRAPQPPGGAVARPRVVAHAVPDSPSAFAGNGISATQAFFYFLQRRLGVVLISSGFVGLTTPQMAANEAWRAQARAVVMAHIEAVDYQQTPTGPGLRCRLEVVVVRDGRVVLRRVVESPPAPASPSGRRGRELDPMFMAVSQALEAIAGDLAAAVADPR
ncbi:MAG TPA: hypothetical protein VFF06_05940 [Polyangia bacterium]|nr:hypothetical protein [Polyangia bacterium]